MTEKEKKETKEKIMELVKDMIPEIEKKVDSVLENSPIEIKDESESKWGLSKTILSAVLTEMAWQYEPPKSLTGLRRIYKMLKSII